MLRRLLALVVSVGLIVVAAVVIGRIVLVPVAEGRVESAVGRSFGAEADATLDPPLGSALLRGDVGDVRVRLARVLRDGIAVEDVDVRVVDTNLDVRRLLDRAARLRFARMAFSGVLTEQELTTVVRSRLAAARIPGAGRARVDVTPERVLVLLPNQDPVPVRVRVASQALRVEVLGTGPTAAALARAVRRPVSLGRLPYGLRVTRVRAIPDGVVVTGGRGPGVETFR